MASPQIEHGYTKIANELLQAIYKYITNPTWLRVALLIIRLTYGWNRKEVISNVTSFATTLRISEEYIKNILIEMEHSCMVRIEWKGPRKFKLSLEKDYEKWTFVKR